jgi:hypothetical protein
VWGEELDRTPLAWLGERAAANTSKAILAELKKLDFLALGNGLVQPIFRPPSRRSPSDCFPSLFPPRRRPKNALRLYPERKMGNNLCGVANYLAQLFARLSGQLPPEHEAFARARSSTSLFKSRMLPPVNSDDWLCQISEWRTHSHGKPSQSSRT